VIKATPYTLYPYFLNTSEEPLETRQA